MEREEVVNLLVSFLKKELSNDLLKNPKSSYSIKLNDELNNESFESHDYLDFLKWRLGEGRKEFVVDGNSVIFLLEMEEEFGGEGMGDHMFYVFSIANSETPNKTFVKISGYYDSWDGSEYNSLEIVKPVEVVKIKWEKV